MDFLIGLGLTTAGIIIGALDLAELGINLPGAFSYGFLSIKSGNK